MESISVKHESGTGRPRKRPKVLYADTKYNMPLNVFYLDGKHIKSQMPSVSTKGKRGRPRLLDRAVYNKVRSMIERFYGWMKAFRRIATRYERLVTTYMGFVHIACMIILLRNLRKGLLYVNQPLCLDNVILPQKEGC